MILALIAGTATPVLLLCVPPPPASVTAVTVMWAVTAAAALTRLLWLTAPEQLVGALFLSLGWGAAAAVPAVWVGAGVAPAVLLIAGGVLYTIGAVCYHYRRPDPVPAAFGYHEVFHVFVSVAAACHYAAIAVFPCSKVPLSARHAPAHIAPLTRMGRGGPAYRSCRWQPKPGAPTSQSC
jgi:hemolysin III